MGDTDNDWFTRADQARSAGDMAAAWDLAVSGLAEHPDDPRLLRLAGAIGSELGKDGATDHLRRLVRVAPDDGGAWRELGLALLDEGRPDEAASALQTALDQQPDDLGAVISLAHLRYTLGDPHGGIALLDEAADRVPDDVATVRHLVAMYRATDQPGEALRRARDLAARRPKDTLVLLDLAELELESGHYAEATAAYRALEGTDDEPGHASYIYHGMVEADILAGHWRRALDVAIAATAADRDPLTTDLLSFVASKLFGRGEHPPPSWEELAERLRAGRRAHRNLHEEAVMV